MTGGGALLEPCLTRPAHLPSRRCCDVLGANADPDQPRRDAAQNRKDAEQLEE